MKAIILDEQVKVYSSMDTNNLSIATLQQGSEIEYGGTKRKAGKQWVPIILSTGQQAFIPGETKIAIIREGQLKQASADLHSEPSAGSLIKQQLKLNSKLAIMQVVRTGQEDWVRVRDESGNEGYISGQTRIRLIVQKTKAKGRKNMISGVMWLAVGLLWVLSERSTAAGSSYLLLGYAALLFGVVMLVSGIIQYVTAPA